MPSVFTTFNLFLGFLALLDIIRGNFKTAVYLITASFILDGLDGTLARLTKTESNFGMQLDSLVDGITFGLVTSIMLYFWGFAPGHSHAGIVICFIFLSAGVIRLARFNVLKEVDALPANMFIGFPIPFGALSICSLVLIFPRGPVHISHNVLISAFTVFVAFMMVSNVKYRTAKSIRIKNNLLIVFFLATFIALLIMFPDQTIPSITFIYLISPVYFFMVKSQKKKKRNKPVRSKAHPS